MSIMKTATLAVALFLGLQPLSNGQRPTSPVEGAAAVQTAPVTFISNSVVDNHGNLFIFQTVSQKTTISTRVTIVTPTKTAVGPREYAGVFSSIVVANQAIYAINTTSASTSTGSLTTLITLVALKPGSTGDLPAVLPSFSMDAYAEIRIAPGQSTDLIYLIQTSSALLRTIAIPVVQANFVRLVQFDGSLFKDLGKVQLP